MGRSERDYSRKRTPNYIVLSCLGFLAGITVANLISFCWKYEIRPLQQNERLRPLREAYDYCESVPRYKWNEPLETALGKDPRFSCQQINDLYHRLGE